MFVNFCSKLAFMKFNRLTFINHKERHVITYRRPRISSKMLPTFSNSAWPNQQCWRISIDAQFWTTEPVYRPVFAGCLPLKCVFFIFFQKTSFMLFFASGNMCWANAAPNFDVFDIWTLHNSFVWKLIVESASKLQFVQTDWVVFIWHAICNAATRH